MIDEKTAKKVGLRKLGKVDGYRFVGTIQQFREALKIQKQKSKLEKVDEIHDNKININFNLNVNAKE